ncbi:MAG: PAS domain S-box protein, partial [Planctomycetota bacterium]|jgi:PAS domain S-box-containing protein
MRQGLERGQKIVYIVDARSAEQILSYLREDGLDVEDYIKSGQLNVLSVDESYMLEGVFDPDGMIRLLEKETRRALDEGYSALRVTGEMSWALRGLPGSERLMEYESKLNTFFPDNKCLAICQYDRRKFTPEILLNVLTTHPIAIIGTEVFDNYYYVSPKELRDSDPETARLNNWLLNLKARKIIDKTLRESEHKYRMLVDNSYDVVYSVKPDGVITFVSPQIRNFGYSPEEVISRNFLEFVVPEMRGMVLHEFERGMTSGESFPTVFQWQGKDGHRYWVEVVGMTEYDESGRPLLQTGVMRDITDRKNTEDALQESEKTARAFLNANTDSGILVNREGLIIDLNDKMARSLGKNREDMIGTVIYDYLPADLAEQRKAMGFAAAEKRKPVRFEDRREDRWLENSVYPILNPDGEVERFAIFSRDITEHKQAEEALRKSQADLARAQSIAHIGNWEWDVRSGKVGWSDEIFRIFGLERQEPSYELVKSLIHPDDTEFWEGSVNEAIYKSKPFTIDYRSIRPDGSIVWIHNEAEIVRDEQGNPLKMFGTTEDVTERKKAEERLKQAKEEMAKLARFPAENPNPVLRISKEARIIFANKASDIVLETWERRVGETLPEPCSQRAKEVFQSGKVFTFEFNCHDDTILLVTLAPIVEEGYLNAYGVDITELKQAEEEFRKARDEWERTFESVPDLIFILDMNHRIVRINKTVAERFGCTKEDIVGKFCYEVIHGEEAPPEFCPHSQLLADGQEHRAEVREERLKGDFSVSVTPLRDVEGKLVGAVHVAHDITERKGAEEALKAEKEFTETALNAQTDTFFVLEPSTGRAIRWNEAFRTQSGYDDEEIRSKKAPDSYYSKEDLDKARAAIAKILDGETTTVELNLITKDGKTIPTEYTGSVMTDTEGTPRFIIAVGRDITVRRRAEQVLQQSEKRFRTLVEGLGQGYFVFMHDLDGNVKYLSPAIEAMIGLKPDQLIGHHWKEYVEWTEEALAAGIERGRKIRETGQPPEPFVMSFKSGGDIRYVEIAERPTLDDAGNIIGVEGIAKEVTEEVRATESLRRMRDELEMRVEERTAELRQSIDKLRETELRYRTVANFNYDWEYWENPDFTLNYVSPSCERLTGYKEQEFIDNPGLLAKIILDEDRGIWEQHRVDALTEPKMREIQFRIRTKDGEVRWIGHACRPVLGNRGEFLGFRASNRDIMDRKKVEEALRENEAVLRRKEQSLAKAQRIAHLGNWDWDIVTNDLLWSDETYRIFGLQPQEFDATYEAFLESVHIDDRESVQQAVNKSLTDPNAGYSIEHRVIQPDGSERIVHELGEVTFDKNGKAVRMVGIVHDITERKRAELELTRSREALRMLAGRLLSVQEEERRRLARELHDDLTQRLAVLAIDMGKLEVKSDSSPESFASKIKEIRERTIELSSDIHDISRQLHPAILDDLGLRQAIHSECVNFTRREGIKINYEPKDIPLMIPRDVSVCLFRIVQEGLRNIAKYAKVEEASVRLIGDDGGITLIVQDSGAGFDMARSADERGVGLASMQERVRLIRGDFSIESQPGQGTVIKVVANYQESEK